MANLHEKVTNQRNDFLHKVSTKIVKDNQIDTVCMEDLNVKGMMKNHCLAKAISSASWSKFVTMVQYKCDWYGKNFIQIGRFEASSKTCSCGSKNQNLSLKDRFWTCSACGLEHDRDVLAANNIKKFGIIKKKLEAEGTTSSINKSCGAMCNSTSDEAAAKT